MKAEVGLWIDHRRALIGKVTGKEEEAESSLRIGTGGATGEPKKRPQKITLGGRIVGMEAIDRMTDRQIAAKVRRCFQESNSRQMGES